MNYTKKDFKVGQILFVKVEDKRHSDYELTIKNIGNKYLTCDKYKKVNIEKMRIEQDFGIGDKVWFLKELYEKDVQISLLKKEIISKLPYNLDILLQIKNLL